MRNDRTAEHNSSGGAQFARFELPFVGRGAERDQIENLLRGGTAGRGATLFVAGEAGVGKTRLIAELVRVADSLGWQVATGHAYEMEGGCPYAVFADALTPMCERLEPADVAAAAQGTEGELAHIVPFFARARAGADSPERSQANSPERSQANWHLASFLGAIAADRPLLLVLESLHWADPSSLQLLHFLGRLALANLFIIATYQDRDQGPPLALEKVLQSLTANESAQRLRVEPLAADDVVEMIRKALPSDDPALDAFARRLHKQSGGNPFYAREILRSLLHSGALHKIGGRWTGWESDASQLTDTGRAVVVAKIRALSDEARRVAAIMSAFGAPIEPALLSCIAGGGDGELSDALDELCGRGMVVASADRDRTRYDFAHAIVRSAVYGELTPARARGHHVAIVNGLEAYYGADAPSHAAEFAPHLVHAADEMPAERSAPILVAAGQAALARRADVEAERFLSAALAVVERAGAEVAAHARLSILQMLAKARQRTGDYPGAQLLLNEAHDLAQGAQDVAAIARIERRMGLGAFFTGDSESAVRHLSASEKAARDVGDVRLAVRALIARAVALQSCGHSGEARALITSALGRADAALDDDLLSRLHRAIVLLYSWTGPWSVARRHGDLALKHATAAQDLGLTAWVHWALALMAGLAGDGAGLRSHLDAAEQIAARLNSPILLAQCAEIAIEFASGSGEWDDALVLADRYLPVARAIAPQTLFPRLLVWSAIILLERDEEASALARFREAWAIAGAEGAERERTDAHVVIPACIGMATYYLRTHDFPKAVSYAERGLAHAEQIGATTWGIHRLMPILCEALIWLQEFDRAEVYTRRLRAESEQLEHPLGLAYADATEALLQRFRDNRGDAHGLMVAAAERLEAIPFRFPAARLRLNAAQLLMFDGRFDDALVQLRLAEDAFTKMGAIRELRIVRERLRLVGGRPKRAAGFSFGEKGLTEREREIVAHVASGKTNKEIAAALRLGVRTIDAHLRRIFAKVGVRSRAGLVGRV